MLVSPEEIAALPRAGAGTAQGSTEQLSIDSAVTRMMISAFGDDGTVSLFTAPVPEPGAISGAVSALLALLATRAAQSER
jgi:hypothetical protein